MNGNWRALVSNLTPHATFFEPATEPEIALAEKGLGVSLPVELKSLYRESNGIRCVYELGLVWPIDQTLSENQAYRSNPEYPELYMPFEPLLFFGDAGNGDLFAYTVLAGQVRRPDVFVWNHETDDRTWAAPDLIKYLEWWLSGRLKV